MSYLAYHEERYGANKRAAILIRKQLLWFTAGFPGCKALRQRLALTEDLDAARSLKRPFDLHCLAICRLWD